MSSQEKLTTIATVAIESGIKLSSLADLLLVAEGQTIAPGDQSEWIEQQRAARPEWFTKQKPETSPSPKPPAPQSEENPWTHHCWNLTRQGQFVLKHGMEKAEQMAKRAGTTVGGPKPKQAPATSATSTTSTTPGRDAAGRFLSKNDEEPNPFSSEHWNLTKQAQLVKNDPKKAEELAKKANTTIGAPRPRAAPDRAIAVVFKTRRR